MTTAYSPAKRTSTDLEALLGAEADDLLGHTARGFDRKVLHLPGPDFVSRVFAQTDRTPAVLRNFQSILDHGRLGSTGYVSILPVDQGIEHSAGASFAPNPMYFDPENIVRLAIEGGCNAVASTLGVLGSCSRKYAHRIPFLRKLNHNELITYPNAYEQIMFGQVEQAFDMGAVAVGATIYFGSADGGRELQEVSAAFARAHELGLVTVLWCYLRNSAFKVDGVDYHTSADLTGQANHLGATIEADILKQKLPENNAGYKALNKGSSKFGKFHERMYSELSSDHPIDLCRYQLANGYLGRVPLINSGGASGDNDFAEAARTAVINKRAGGMGLISGRKAFQRPMEEGVRLLNIIQDVYLDGRVTVAQKPTQSASHTIGEPVMSRTTLRPVAFAALGVTLALGAAATADETASVAYELTDEASYQEGCFDPCMCPIMMATELSGTFSVTPLVINGTYDTYQIADVDWNVSLLGGEPWYHITGGGTLTIFSEVAVIQRLELDLVLDDEPAHFDSGPVVSMLPLPALDLTISMNGMFCYDIAMRVAAKPASGPCPCDIDGDTSIGFGDLTQLVLHWGACEPAPLACMGDVDHTGSVGFADLTALLTSWGACVE